MQSLSLQKALPEAPEAKPMPVPLNALKAKPMPAEGKPPELRKQSLCQCPEGKAYALKAKPMPAPEASCDESPRNIPFHPVSAFHRFSVSPVSPVSPVSAFHRFKPLYP
jgi:hypothetical protein